MQRSDLTPFQYIQHRWRCDRSNEETGDGGVKIFYEERH
jgi:hypothetical protein